MTDVIIPTWTEVNSYIAIAIALIVFIVCGLIKAKREDSTVKWMRDWEEY